MVRTKKITAGAAKIPVVEKKKGSEFAKALGQRIKESREKLKITQETLAQNFTRQLEVQGLAALMSNKGRGRSAIAQWETGRASPEFKTIPALARALNQSAEYLAFGVTGDGKTVAPDPVKLGYVMAPEIIVTGPEKFEEHQIWGIPTDFLRSELGIHSFENIAIAKVEVDTAPYEYGDRVIVDRANFRPSPPGHFLYWDGLGANIAKMMVVPSAGKKPKVKVSGATGEFEADVDKLTIIGRVRGVWKKG